MNYTITPTETPDIFTLEDERGKKIADVRGENVGNLFAHLPELLEFLDDCMDDDTEFPYFDGNKLQEKLKPFRT